MIMKKYLLILGLNVVCFLQVQSQKPYRDNPRFDSLIKVLPSLRGTERINCLNLIAEFYCPYYSSEGIADSATFYTAIAYEEAKKIGDKTGIAKSLLNLNGIEETKRYARQAARIFDTAANRISQQFQIENLVQIIKLGEELNDNEILGKAYSQKGNVQWGLRDFPVAIENYKKSIGYCQLAGDIKTMVESNHSIYWIYSEKGNYEECFDYIFNAAKLTRKAVSQYKYDKYMNYLYQESLSNLGYLYSSAGDDETALKYQRENNQFATANNTGWTLEGELGDTFRKLGLYDSSFYYLKKQIETKPSDLMGKINLGNVYIDLKDYEKGMRILQEAIDSIKKRKPAGAGIYIGHAWEGVAKIYLARKEYDSSLKYAKYASNMLRFQSEWAMNCHELLSNIYHALGMNDSAYSYLKKYMIAKDSIISRQFLLRLRNYNSQIEIERKESALALLNRDNNLKGQQLKQEVQLKKFLIIGLVGFLFIGFFVLRWLTLKRKNDKLENMKTQVELKQKATELEMQALRAQMNPHFIFNCLSSINRFIIKNETEAASDYLTRFSRLIRMVLINSQKSLITLEDELEMLRLYLDMERLRFKNSFDYNINFKNTVDVGTIFIPPLLLQPFCENAIWHGLMHKDGLGTLDIAINMQDNVLNCTITDNGVGREKAAELKSKSVEKEKSLGLKITRERLALLNQDNDSKTFYEIEDLFDEKANAAGTKIKLQIKYKESVEELV